jgi:hypothetical protein
MPHRLAPDAPVRQVQQHQANREDENDHEKRTSVTSRPEARSPTSPDAGGFALPARAIAQAGPANQEFAS